MGQETYEVWIRRGGDSWSRVADDIEDDTFADKKKALAIAGSASRNEDVAEVVVIERRPILRLNGPGVIGGKGQMAFKMVKEEKKEESDADEVHGGSPKDDPVQGAGL